MSLLARHLIPLALLAGCNASASRMSGTPSGDDSGTIGGPCAVEQPEPNDTPDHATVLTTNPTDGAFPIVYGCMSAATDVDMFEFNAPATDRAGGYYSIRVKFVGDGFADLKIFAASDGGQIEHEQATTSGASATAFFASSPGQKYRIAVGSGSEFAAPFPYGLEVIYWRIIDGWEPNDTLETAPLLSIASDYMAAPALLFAGYRSSTIELAEYQDFFRAPLAAGSVTLQLISVPQDVLGELSLLDSAGRELARAFATSAGAEISIPSVHIPAAETYYIRAGVAVAPLAAGPGTEFPAHFTHAAFVKVKQP